MKYASEVIDLLGAHPQRDFRMMEIVNYILGSGTNRKQRESARKAVKRVLEAMEESGSITKMPSPYERGGYSTYRIVSSAIYEAEPTKFGALGETSHAELAEIRLEATSNGLPDPYRAFVDHRNRAVERGIGFELTFCEWWGYWKDCYSKRGRGHDDLCMARKGDVGPYAKGNVYIATQRENKRDYATSEKKKRDLVALKERRKQKLMDIIKEVESLPPPQYSYEEVCFMLKFGIPFELRPNAKAGHGVGANAR